MEEGLQQPRAKASAGEDGFSTFVEPAFHGKEKEKVPRGTVRG